MFLQVRTYFAMFSRLVYILLELANHRLLLGYQQIKQKQKMWSVDNGLRVHQRGGMGDAILYNTCLGLIVIGGYLWVDTVYTLAFPKK